MSSILAHTLAPGFVLAWKALVFTSVIWLPASLAYLFLWLWLYYVRSKWVRKLEWVLLEVRLPKEIVKTPQAMETILMALHLPLDAGNLLKKWFEGEARKWSSLEIVSLGGSIHLFIRVLKENRNRVESAIYSQYPEAEIFEAEDYTKNVPYGLPGSGWKLMATEFAFGKEDAYPIKTYLDYGLDKVTDPEDTSRVDPMTPMLEFLGTLKPGEQVWYQFLIMATRKRFEVKKKWGEIWYQPSEWFKKQDWTDEAKAVIKKIREAGNPPPKEGETPRFSILSPGDVEKLSAIERTLGKPAFDVGIRAIYLGDGDAFTGPNFGGMISCVVQYSSVALNNFKTLNLTAIKYPWQDLTGQKLALKKARLFNAFLKRSYFYPPYVGKPMVLSTEELATVYHFPGRIAATPTLKKIESKRAEPPTNLPIAS